MSPLIPIALAGSALVAWLAARGRGTVATFDDFRKAFPLYLEAKAVERDRETKTSHEPLQLSDITLENGGYSCWMQAGGKYRLFWWRVPSKPFDLEMNFQALRAAVNLAVTSKERETLPTVIQAGDFPTSAYLYIYTASGWVGIGWFGPKPSTYGGSVGALQNAKEQGARRVGRDGWFYVYESDGNGAMYHTDQNGMLWA